MKFAIRYAALAMDSAPEDPSVEAKVRTISASQPGVVGLDKCHARKMGLSYYVDLHIVVNGQISVQEGHRIAHSVEDAILKALPQVSEVLVHVEPEEEFGIGGSNRKSKLAGPLSEGPNRKAVR